MWQKHSLIGNFKGHNDLMRTTQDQLVERHLPPPDSPGARYTDNCKKHNALAVALLWWLSHRPGLQCPRPRQQRAHCRKKPPTKNTHLRPKLGVIRSAWAWFATNLRRKGNQVETVRPAAFQRLFRPHLADPSAAGLRSGRSQLDRPLAATVARLQRKLEPNSTELTSTFLARNLYSKAAGDAGGGSTSPAPPLRYRGVTFSSFLTSSSPATWAHNIMPKNSQASTNPLGSGFWAPCLSLNKPKPQV
jgi:hypothetical protein